MMNNIQSGIVKVLRTSGKALDALGKSFEVNPHVDKLIPCTRVVKLGANIPVINGAFVASSASVIGKVKIGASSSVWYGAVIRGDVSTISIGDSVTVGDRAMIHCTGASDKQPAFPTIIGNKVVIGAGAILHGCILEDECYIGEGAQVMDGATIHKHSKVAAGSLVSSGKVIPSGQLWSGVPAKYLRDLTALEIASISKTAEENSELSSQHAMESAKNWIQIDQELDDWDQIVTRNDYYYKRLTEEEISFKKGNLENDIQHPGRIFNAQTSARKNPDPRPIDK